jgi:hypothetical protein
MYVKNEYGYKKRVKKKIKRPTYITLLCVGVVVYGFWNIISSYMGIYNGFGTLYPAINALMIVFSFVAISGVWSMEKWGAVTFPIVITLKLLVDVLWNHFNPWLLLAFIPAAVFLSLFPKMKRVE